VVVEDSFQRGASQVLFNYLPSQLIEYPEANSVVLIKSWSSKESTIPSKKRVLEKVYKEISRARYMDVDRLFPKKPEINSFYFGEPFIVSCNLFPLVFTEEKTNEVHFFKSINEFESFLDSWQGGKLIQRDIIFISPSGEMDQLQPPIDPRRRPLKLEKISYGGSQASFRWVDADTGEIVDRVYGILNKKRINVGTPVRARSTFIPQTMNLVNIRDYIDAQESEGELLGSIILARYIYGSEVKGTLHDTFERLKKTPGSDPNQSKKLDKIREALPEALKKDLDSVMQNWLNDAENAQIYASKIRSIFSRSEILSALDQIYEYIETVDSEGKITLQELLENAESETKKAMYGQFIEKLNDIGVISAA